MKDLEESAVKQATIAAEGNLKAAAEALGVTRTELAEYFASRPDMQMFLDDLRDQLFDDSQEALREAVDEKAPWAIRRVLTTLGAGRGYGPAPKPVDNPAAAKPQASAETATPTAVDTPNPAGNAGPQPNPEATMPVSTPTAADVPAPAMPAAAMPL